MNILVINPGSTTVKFKLFKNHNNHDYSEILSGLFENKQGRYVAELDKDGQSHEWEISQSDFNRSADLILKEVEHYDIAKIGFRIVHGGEVFQEPTLLTPESIKRLEEYNDLAPLHNPPAIKLIKQMQTRRPDIEMFGVFDTAFHKTMPDYSYLYAIPQHFYKEFKIRRYGFHGSSHAYVYNELNKLEQSKNKVITCHLGGGASISAILDGKCIDTSMGFTPTEGLMMATRSGDLDDGVSHYLIQKEHYTVQDMQDITNKHSGLLGVSELTSDMRTLLAQEETNENARLAIQMYIYRIQKYIGSFAAAMGGVDSLVFTAGVGAGSSVIRARVCQSLSFLNVHISEANKDRENVTENLKISSEDSIPVWVIPTNEELYIAQQAT